MVAIVSDFRRHLQSAPGMVRAEVLQALSDLGYTVSVNQLTRIEATRGSKLGAAMLLPKKMPVRIKVDVEILESGCDLIVHVEDALDSPVGRSYGVNGVYQKVFSEIQERVDAGLSRLEPAAAAAQFAPPVFASTTPTLQLVERANEAVGRGEERAVAAVNTVLAGGSGPGSSSAWKGLEQVWFESGDRVAVLSLAEAETHLAITLIVDGQPGALPDKLVTDLDRFAARVERAMSAAAPGVVRIPVSDEERPILEFMHSQVRIRDGLPVRTLHRCRDCRFEKITNPDFERLMERNRKLRSLASAAGATISSGGIRPFVVVGALFRLKSLDPSYTCPRCQAMQADEALATFCPACGDLRKEAVLRSCPKCHHDFLGSLTPEDPPFWAALHAMSAPTPSAAPGSPWPAPTPAR